MCAHDFSNDTPSLGKARKIPSHEITRTSGQACIGPSLQSGGRRNDTPRPPAPPGLPDSWDEPDPMQRRYVLVYRNGILTAAFYSTSEAESSTAGDYDLEIDLVARKFVIRRPDGTLLVLQGTIRGIGVVPLQLLFKFLRLPVAVLPPVHWGLMEPEFLGGDEVYLLAPIIARLRKWFFGERGSQHFIVTAKPLAYGWNRDRSFRIIALNDRWWEL